MAQTCLSTKLLTVGIVNHRQREGISVELAGTVLCCDPQINGVDSEGYLFPVRASGQQLYKDVLVFTCGAFLEYLVRSVSGI